MNPIKWNVRLGDETTITIGLLGLTEIPVGATVAAYVLDGQGLETDLNAPTVVDEVERIISIDLGTWLTDVDTDEDTYSLFVRVNEVTWPEVGRAKITVDPRNRNPVVVP